MVLIEVGMTNIIDYKKIMHSASLAAIQTVLLDVSKNGLPGDHHFYITFDMSASGVETSMSLKEKYPDEMTIVIQNWYDGFTVTESSFSITLNFGNVRETMQIPFSAIKSFVDPSVEFGLSFESQLNTEVNENIEINPNYSDNKDNQESRESERLEERKSGEVVSLESFRKP